ncbi:MAG: hypothetical protein K2Y23_09770 [Cyanobacteria bacterium]|nr:hypothetical protein [Cyanobacteriota bacterium]
MDDLKGLLLAMPVALAAQWAAWFGVGLALSIWGRREKMRVWDDTPPTKPKSGVRRVAKSRHSAGDAFGELEALLEQQQEGTHRMPGEAPAPATEKHTSPVLNEAPRLAAPQSLP